MIDAEGSSIIKQAVIERDMLDIDVLRCLVCPLTGCKLLISEDGQWLISKKARLAFPIKNGVPVLKVEFAKTLEE